MVLQDLGRKINGALSRLNNVAVVDQEILNAILKDICNALIQSDVNIKLVMGLRKNIAAACNLEPVCRAAAWLRGSPGAREAACASALRVREAERRLWAGFSVQTRSAVRRCCRRCPAALLSNALLTRLANSLLAQGA